MMTKNSFIRQTVLAAGLLAVSLNALAEVSIDHAWARATVGPMKASGAFMTVTSDQAVSLVGASSDIAGVTEVHQMRMEKQIMRMRRVEAVDIAAGASLELKPGGYHVMLMELPKPLDQGSTIQITLHFKDAKGQPFSKQVAVPVKAMTHGKKSMSHHGKMKH